MERMCLVCVKHAYRGKDAWLGQTNAPYASHSCMHFITVRRIHTKFHCNK